MKEQAARLKWNYEDHNTRQQDNKNNKVIV